MSGTDGFDKIKKTSESVPKRSTRSTRPQPNTDSSPVNNVSSNTGSAGSGERYASKLGGGVRSTPTGSSSRGVGSTGSGSGSQGQTGSNGSNTGTKASGAGAGNQDKASDKNGSNSDNNQNPTNQNDTKNESVDSKNNQDDNQNGQNDGKNDGQNGRNADRSGKSGQGEGSGGLADKAKDLSPNATGVDYSDKGSKDRLGHQAADVAMDATPGLGQFNSARKVLKNFNKAKKDATGRDDDVTGKMGEGMDDAVDKGMKGAKFAAGAGMATNGGLYGSGIALIMKTLMLLKTMAIALLSKAVGFIAGIFNAIAGFFTGLLGVAAAVGNAIAGVVMAIVSGVLVVAGVGVFDAVTYKDDGAVHCVPTKTSVSPRTQEYVLEGEQDVIREQNAIKLWSVYSQIGGSKEQTAAVLGNLQAESGLDPTAVETIYNEPFQIGPRKQHAQDVDFRIAQVDADYAEEHKAIEYMGIGLAQWTNERNRLLLSYANEHGVNWYEFDTQIRFMLDGDHEYRQQQLTDFLNASNSANVDAETERFMNTWIGLSSPNASLSTRQKFAQNYMFTLERATVDTDYANSILSGINVNRSSGNHSAGAYHQDDGCGHSIKSHYANQAVDGTGEIPADLALVPWSRETLPDSMREFAKDPSDAGLAWGNATGWASGIIPDQCAALSHSYMMQLYPQWNQDGRPTTRPFGDGKDVARLWAQHFGEKTSDVPQAGAVFSDSTTSAEGHTGIVQHVFANGDILIVEQNIRGVSGRNAPGLSYSWSWRAIKKERYKSEGWTFFKPSEFEPQWVKNQ